jgi:thiamine biosynthesis protein ThiC
MRSRLFLFMKGRLRPATPVEGATRAPVIACSMCGEYCAMKIVSEYFKK